VGGDWHEGTKARRHEGDESSLNADGDRENVVLMEILLLLLMLQNLVELSSVLNYELLCRTGISVG
jgi:hypothetical protein